MASNWMGINGMGSESDIHRVGLKIIAYTVKFTKLINLD